MVLMPLPSFPTRRSSDLLALPVVDLVEGLELAHLAEQVAVLLVGQRRAAVLDGVLQGLDHGPVQATDLLGGQRSEEHTSELQSRQYLVCRLLLEKKKSIT